MIKVYSSQTLKLSIFCREVLEIVDDDAIEDVDEVFVDKINFSVSIPWSSWLLLINRSSISEVKIKVFRYQGYPG